MVWEKRSVEKARALLLMQQAVVAVCAAAALTTRCWTTGDVEDDADQLLRGVTMSWVALEAWMELKWMVKRLLS